MAALRGILLRWRRRCGSSSGGGGSSSELFPRHRRLFLWSLRAPGSEGAPGRLSAALVAGATGGAAAWFLCQRFYGERESQSRRRAGAAQEAARGLLPIPVAAAAKEATILIKLTSRCNSSWDKYIHS